MFMCAPSVKLKFQRFDEATMNKTKCLQCGEKVTDDAGRI